VVTPAQIETVVKKSTPHAPKGTTVSRTTIHRFSRVEPARRLLLSASIVRRTSPRLLAPPVVATAMLLQK
jgi:hypothetical protein